MDESFVIRKCRIIVNVIFAITLAYIISYIFFTQVLQQGFSMTPNINDRNIALVNRLYRGILPIKRNDIIAFNINDQDSIKRVYGIPGDTVAISSGYLYINGTRVENEDIKNSLSSNMEQNVKLGSGEYYVLGDNLDSSKDSRFGDIGNIKISDIIGKVWFIIK